MPEKKSDIDKALEALDDTNPYASFLDKSTMSNVTSYFDTGSMILNAIISGSLYGGVPENRITMFCGGSMVGKTYLVLKILANAQKAGKIPVIFDTENAVDEKTATSLGLDTSKVKYVPSFSIEETRNSIYKFLKAVKDKGQEGKFIIAIDSLGNLESQLQMQRMEKDNTSSDMGSKARAMKSLLLNCTQLATLTKTTFIMTNHVYDDPAALFPSLVKNMPGGKAAIYLPSVTVQLARKPEKDDKDNKLVDSSLAVGQKSYSGVILRALTVKNRFIKQYLEGEMYLSFERGLDKYYGLLDLAKGVGAVIQNGSTYELPDGKKLGYYKNWRKDEKVWEENILPIIEEKIKVEWKYGNNVDEGDGLRDDIPLEDE